MSEYFTSAPTQDDITQETKLVKGDVVCRYVTGAAGTGKTYLFRRRIELDEKEGILCATTGVAAVNLGTTTLHSTLGFYDTESLEDAFADPNKRLVRRIIQLRKVYGYRSLMIDEASMLGKYPLGIITEAFQEANGRMEKDNKQIAIELTGDFAQLPPVNEDWAFKSEYWPKYAANLVKLDKIYRQSDPEFLAALNFARRGMGAEASEALRPLVKWAAGTDLNFQGTTIVAKNSEVDSLNKLRYMKLGGAEKRFGSRRWGKQKSEWKNVPESIQLKEGTLVMILSNGYEFVPDEEHVTFDEYGNVKNKRVLVYANGDTGTVVGMSEAGVEIELIRNGRAVLVPFLTRPFESKDAPVAGKDSLDSYLDEKRERWVLGGITYMPVRLAYAVTCHKSQGLTLDSVQIDPRGHFFGSPNMMYVALSRARSPKHLKIVGTPEMLARRINVHPDVGEWI